MRVNVLLPVGLILTLALGSVVGCGNNPVTAENGATLAPAGKVALSQVPTKVLEAANKAVPGGEVKDVETEVEDGELIYEVKKVVDGVKYEIEVTADGAVKEVEEDDDD
ncbi:PepSY domain-containing protein [bacterium]|nr:PepSY domain-containing protein [bacterium]